MERSQSNFCGIFQNVGYIYSSLQGVALQGNMAGVFEPPDAKGITIVIGPSIFFFLYETSKMVMREVQGFIDLYCSKW